MDRLELIIKDYISKMKKDYNVIGAMLTGSYTTKTMQANSDIDIFFIWEKENKSMRGREFYSGIEFEYFISPEWKYYDRLKSDLTSQQIYSTGKIVFDTRNIFNNIKEKAVIALQSYNPELSISEKADYSFYVETIMRDGIDMVVNGELGNYHFLSGMHIPRFCNIIAKIKKKYPLYEKYALEQIGILDEKLLLLIIRLYESKGVDEIYGNWTSLCKYILSALGDIDIKNYQVVSKLERL